ncbi:VACUOLAR PROTEIN SORTING-ASSOCIATED PROTEIN IST1-RELATED [Salix viminalis]|uniref:VACUOLAR PROTEIN SORTING-ASSOCIATED PROTEIN IST1-RELATED n=1 Tax=Salix viminalis TaxID=40686 RepID=A0A9Q0QJG9_SALVM|nr:VACUOLAR PROTEIN SORTING-ASSOCIATED PROTEIN IST1-RELATED [Salix viminalis]
MARKLDALFGRKLDSIFGRKSKRSKFGSLAKLAVSRIAILKNKTQVRFDQAKSDVIQLLNLGHQERALLRVEHVIKNQNMVDVYAMMEDYLHFLNDRIVQLETNKECPDELKEAVSSLIFASSRCGEFPELQEIRGDFVSRFGKQIAACAVELRSNCGVNPKIIQKFSTTQASLESRKKLLKDIASENGIVLHLEEDAPLVAQEKMDFSRPKQHAEDSKPAKFGVTESQARTHVFPEEELSESLKGRKKYKDVAAAAQEAFESAAYAAHAARAAVELSRYDSRDDEQDDRGDSSHGQGSLYDSDGSLTPDLRGRYEASEENKRSNDRMVFNGKYTNDNISSESEDENVGGNGRVHLGFEESRTNPGFDRTLSNSSSDSVRNMWNERNPTPKHHDLDLYRNTNLLEDENQHIREYNAVHEDDISYEDENELPHQSPKWIPLKSHAGAMINPKKGNYEDESARSTTSAENSSARSNIDRKRSSVRTTRARGA